MPHQTPTPRDVARHVLDELNELRTFVDEHAPDDPAQWRNLEDLLRLTATEAARVWLGVAEDPSDTAPEPRSRA